MNSPPPHRSQRRRALLFAGLLALLGATTTASAQDFYVHIRALHDDNGRIVAVAIHNSDVSDGWEREGENANYFKIFSEPRAYPLGINIITYFMTH